MAIVWGSLHFDNSRDAVLVAFQHNVVLFLRHCFPFSAPTHIHTDRSHAKSNATITTKCPMKRLGAFMHHCKK